MAGYVTYLATGALAWEKGKMSAETEICQKLGIGGEKPKALRNND